MKKRSSIRSVLPVFIALAAGIAVGLLLSAIGKADLAASYLRPIGTIFLNLLQFVIAPVVATSIISGVISIQDAKKIGRVGIRTLIYYLVTTALAITIGMLISLLFKNGYPVLSVAKQSFVPPVSEEVNFMDTLVSFFPSNFISPFLNSEMLQIIVASLLFGFGILAIGEKANGFRDWVQSAGDVCVSVMNIILKFAPIAVFCLFTPVVAENGAGVLGSLGLVLLVAFLGFALHMAIVYSAAVWTMGGVTPIRFFKGMWPAMLMAFSTASSIGAMPYNMECSEKLGAKHSITSFVIPLGATINMDGTAIYQGVCAIFIAKCFGVDLTFSQMMTIVLTATLASIGTAGVPGSGMLMLSMVLESVGLPVEGIALVAGIDRLFDMGRTVVNITGDASCAIVMSNLEIKKEQKDAALKS